MQTWDKIERMRKPFYTKARRQYKAALNAQLSAFLAMVKSADSIPEIEQAANVFRASLNPMLTAYENVYVTTGIYFGEKTYNELNKSVFTSVLEQTIRATILKEVGKRITFVNDYTQEEVQRITANAVKQSVEKGATIYEIKKLIQRDIKDMSAMRAERIARTEVISASNYGSFAVASNMSINLRKKWIATRDGRTRDQHSAMNGVTVGLHDKFVLSNPADQMEYPGDPAALNAESVINCRCTLVYERI